MSMFPPPGPGMPGMEDAPPMTADAPPMMNPFPAEFVDAVGGDPGAFVGAMQGGMEAFNTAINEGGDPGAAMDAFAATAGPMCEEMGISPEMFEAAGEAFGDCAGFAMQAMPEGGDIGAIMTDAASMMLPEGTEMPPEMGGMFGDMATAMNDAGVGANDMGAEMCSSPMPDGFIPGDPGSLDPQDCQPPPSDGAMADAGMMPPPDGYPPPPGMEGAPPPGLDEAFSGDMGAETVVESGVEGDMGAMMDGAGAPTAPAAGSDPGMDPGMGSDPGMDPAMDPTPPDDPEPDSMA